MHMLAERTRHNATVARFFLRFAVGGLVRPPPAGSLFLPVAVCLSLSLCLAVAVSASEAMSRRQRPLQACAALPLPTISATFAQEDVPQVDTAILSRAFSSSDQLTGGA